MKQLLIVLVVLCIHTYAQQPTRNNTIDSLIKVLTIAKNDTSKVKTLLRISDEFSTIGEFEVSLSYANKGLDLAKSLMIKKGTTGWHKGMVKAYTSIGSTFYRQGKFNISLDNLQLAYRIQEEDRDTIGMCKTQGNFAMLYVRQGNNDKAIESYENALKIQTARGNKAGMAACYGNIGIVYNDKGDFAKALQNAMICMKIFTELGDTSSIATTYQGIGNIFFSQYKYDKAIENYFEAVKLYESIGEKDPIVNLNSNIAQCYSSIGKNDKALEMHLRSLKISKEQNDRDGIAICYNNIGTAYDDLENFDKALENYFSALQMAKETDNSGMVASTYVNIAGTYVSQKKESKAIEYFLLALKMQEENEDIEDAGRTCNRIGNLYLSQGKAGEAKKYLLKSLNYLKETGAKNLIKSAYENMALCDSTLGDFKGAFAYYKLFKAYNDSVFNTESSEKMTEVMGAFETEKKEAQIKLLEKEKEKQAAIVKEESKRQQTILYFALGGFVLVALFSGFIFNRFKVTQKQKNIIELKEQETQQQNLVITEQKYVIEERHKEITDSINYAERIQRSFLATKEFLDENLREYFILFKPKDVVSGDFYWGSKFSNSNFVLVTADSTGHGVPGSIMSILNISCLNEAINADKLSQPSEILNATRKKIIEHLSNDGSTEGGKDGMDCSLVSFDFTNKKLTYAAANNPVWIIRDKTFMALTADRMPVGKHDRDSIPFTQHEFELHSGDMVYTLTDGFPDQFGGPKGKKFKYKQLEELLISVSHESMENQRQKLELVFENWRGGLEQVDDVCVIGVRV